MMQTKRGHRSMSTAILAGFGAALALATWWNGERGAAIALVVFYAVAATVAWIWSGRSGDVAALLRAGGDERQRSIDVRATAYAGLATVFFCLGAVLVQTARGADSGPFALVCAVGGLAYIAAVGVIRHRS